MATEEAGSPSRSVFGSIGCRDTKILSTSVPGLSSNLTQASSSLLGIGRIISLPA